MITNLLDTYDRLIAFGKKHLKYLFVMQGLQSISARDKILREIVSNLLIHRDYANAYDARFVIEKNPLLTENSNRPHGSGKLKLPFFGPFPKNPPISKMLREIILPDELDSGMENMEKGKHTSLIQYTILHMKIIWLCLTSR